MYMISHDMTHCIS